MVLLILLVMPVQIPENDTIELFRGAQPPRTEH